MARVYRGRGSNVVLRGSGRELRVAGTFASYYEPGRAATGSVWDALGAPLLALPPGRRRRVLVLGLGGASVARVVRALAPRARIVGVEIDPEVVKLARRWFGLDALGVEVVQADARDYLQRARGRFDAIFEDVFVGRGRAVRKPEGLPEPGLARAFGRLGPGGILATNTLEDGPQAARVLRGFGGALLRIDVEDYDNRILVAGPAGLRAGALRAAVAASPVLGETLPRLRFRTLQRP